MECSIYTSTPHGVDTPQDQLQNELVGQQEIILKQAKQIENYQKQLENLEIRLITEDRENTKVLSKAGRFALLIITYIRADSLERSLKGVFKYLNNAPVDVIVSQDGDNLQVAELIQKFQKKYNLSHIQHKDRTIPTDLKQGELSGYYYIAQHYKFALSYAFNQKYEFAIILEEDIDIAPDFFSYFIKTHELLSQDDTLFCISAWNDNGRPELVKDHEKLYRTDFFPGLGWMLSKKLWQEIEGSWPKGYWDDWLREPTQRKGRACIYPEISRTYTFGLSDGTSLGQFSQQYLKGIVLNDQLVDWPTKNLSYLLKPNYDAEFSKKIKSLKSTTMSLVDSQPGTDILVEYSPETREAVCKNFGLMTDEKAGVIRTSYLGVVTFWRNAKKIYLAPEGIKQTITNIV